jgi:spore coat polysaccharide biosynthesis predicted glycosyltransferase SpsG
MRSLAVATAARRAGWDVVVAGTVDVALARQHLSRNDVSLVPADTSLMQLGRAYRADVIHVDSYEDWPAALTEAHCAGALLSSMQDGTFGRRHADLAIDPTVGSERDAWPGEHARYLGGAAYFPVGDEALAAREARQARAARRFELGRLRGLVVLGGTDPRGLGRVTAVACLATGLFSDLVLVSSTVDEGALRGQDQRWATTASVIPPTPELLACAAVQDLVVTAGGSTTLQLSCVGVPSVVLALESNQMQAFAALPADGNVRPWTTAEQLLEDPSSATMLLRKAVHGIAQDLADGRHLPRLTDGRGAERIVDAWAGFVSAGPSWFEPPTP